MPLALTTTPPSLSSHQSLVFLLQLALLALAALGMGRLAERVGLPAVAGELVTGVLLGPTVLGQALPHVSGWLFPPRAGQSGLLDAVSLLGSVLLVGLTGAHLDLSLLRRRARAAAWVGGASLVVPLGAGLATGFLLPSALHGVHGSTTAFAAFIGTALCASAIPVISKTLADMKLLHRDIGQLIIAAAVVDDAFGWFLLSIVAAMAGDGAIAGRVSMTLCYLVGFILVMAFAGRRVVRYAFRLASGPGPATAVAVGVMLLSASATAAFGLDPVFGAFIGGVLISAAGSEARERLAGLETVVMSVLAPIFLATAGLKMDLTVLGRLPILLAFLAVLAVAVATKFAGAHLGGAACRLPRWERVALGAGLNSRGVVGIVIAATGLRLGVVSPAGATVIVLIGIATSLLAPPLLRRSVAKGDSAEERLREAEMDEWLRSSSTGTPPADDSTRT
ncbi:cation:proton antiporter [Actinoallomurus rhizosphaericola]|uniref:cation:proton antiporter n=1 Tax=Actinoallomurus rhizosphaericola TaxID=2952536 RepID=UPI002093A21C|nr:cation:proton antiporter [Actinoallomurus rhizosphaericola]MCO5995879.1 cation:proton antiporter [Actinoallomurus rhizosphaericola]